MKSITFLLVLIGLGGFLHSKACTGISFRSTNGAYILARTIEWGDSFLPSEYVIIPRGQVLTSYTPTGKNGITFRARYGVVGLSVVQRDFIAEGLNEAGLSAGLFYFPHYGSYVNYDSTQNATTVNDLQFVSWVLSQFATVNEVETAIRQIRIVSIDRPGTTSTVHWRIGDTTGRQVVVEIVEGIIHIYDNPVGVLTNSPGFPWQLTNLNNYVNLYPGSAPPHRLDSLMLRAFGAGSGFLGLPGDVTPPSRFVRAAFYKATAPQPANGRAAVMQCFHILNNFDIPIGTEHAAGKIPDIPSATQWTTATNLTDRQVYYRTSYNSTIRCIDLHTIDFNRVRYQSHPLDSVREQPVTYIHIE